MRNIYDDILGFEYYGEDLKKKQTPELMKEFGIEWERNVRILEIAKILNDRHISIYGLKKEELAKQLEKYLTYNYVKREERMYDEGTTFIDCSDNETIYYIFRDRLVTIEGEEGNLQVKETEELKDGVWLMMVEESHKQILRNYERKEHKEIWGKLSQQKQLQVLKSGYIGIMLDNLIDDLKKLNDEDGIMDEAIENIERIKKQDDV